MAESLCCSPETTTPLLIGSTPIQHVFGVEKNKNLKIKIKNKRKQASPLCPFGWLLLGRIDFKLELIQILFSLLPLRG